MASAADSVQSTSNIGQISTDAGTTKKSFVCLTGFNFTGSTPVTREESWCGSHVALGAITSEWTADLIVNTAPSGTEVSFADLLAIWKNKTEAIIYDTLPSDGSDWYMSASGYITNITKTAQVGALVKATITFSGMGDLDIVA
jgi:hypothetical protein